MIVKINLKIKKELGIRSYLVFFIIVGVQIGVGILSIPRFIFEEARQDAWISVIIAFIYMAIVLTIMFAILGKYKNADIFGIQVDVFGKWIGKFLGTIYILFFLAEFLSVLLTYIEVIQIFIFPTLPTFIMALALVILVIHSVLGGIRTVIGVTFLFTILSPWVLLLLYDPISRIEYNHFFPMFDTSIWKLISGAQTTTFSFLGLELLFIFYPFIENKQKAKLPAYLGIATSSLVVLIMTVVSIGYYSPQYFNKMDWAGLTLFKSVSFSFMERFDYLIITEWMMVILPILALLMYAITHGMKRLYAVPQKKTLYITAIIVLIISSFFKKENNIEKITSFIHHIGFWIVFVYPIILFPFVLIKKKWRNNK